MSRIIFKAPFLSSISPFGSQARYYAFKSDLKIKWVRPEKISSLDPRKSGDQQAMPSFDASRIQDDFAKSSALNEANDLVRRLFTLEFAPRQKRVQSYVNDTACNVQRHKLDRGSVETKIASWTAIIRSLQETLEKHPRNTPLRVNLKELIDRRKKFLKYLRRWDYKRFEWLINRLDIVYKSPPERFHWITRKESLTKLTDKYCDDQRNEKLQEYKRELQEQQPIFLREKIEFLEFMRKEQEECDVQVTVTQPQIDAVKKQLAELLESQAKLENNNDD